MNVFTRLWMVFKANVNALIERLEKPEQVLEQSIRNMQRQTDRLRGDVVNVIAAEKKLKQQVGKSQQEQERWEKNAEMALKQGNEDLAREALRRKKEAVEFTQQLQPQWERQQALAERLKQEFQQLRQKIQDAQRKKSLLVTRLRHAETQKRLQGLLTDLNDTQAFDKFENKVTQIESLNAAQEELQADSLEQQFEALTEHPMLDVDQELAALKERLKLNP